MILREDNLCIRSGERRDIQELELLYEEAVDFFDGDTMAEIVHPADCMRGLDLPKGGKTENYDLLAIFVTDMMIGYAAVYRDFPHKRWVELPFFYIGERARGKGSGSTALRLLKRYFREAGYKTMRVLCSLKNFTALRFLFDHGFETVLDLFENKRRNYKGIALEARLDVRFDLRY